MSSTQKIGVVGAGMGGLTAAIRLAQLGYEVTVLEARSKAGGLAGRFEKDGHWFDYGPYILLDRPGLEWAFEALGLSLSSEIQLHRLDPVYEVNFDERSGEGVEKPVCIYADAERTIGEIETRWPGAGRLYREQLEVWKRIYGRIESLQRLSRPGMVELIASGAWRHLVFLARSLSKVLDRTGFPQPLREVIGIWTHVAGQPMEIAPSPMALVPALIHNVGAYYPSGGIGVIPERLYQEARKIGVRFEFECRVDRLRVSPTVKPRVLTSNDEIEYDAVVSDVGGVGTYLELTELPGRVRRRYETLPLQSPGVCAYLKFRGGAPSTYLRFRLDAERRCRLLIEPHAVDPAVAVASASNDSGPASLTPDYRPARLLAPFASEDLDAQNRYLDELVRETWWREHLSDYEVIARRTPRQWGRDFHLYRDSMNPVMTSRLMRQGRIPHRSPYGKGLYLAGSSTHPGQWVSFCAVSGILVADSVHEDLG